jgi:hypothetical protein
MKNIGVLMKKKSNLIFTVLLGASLLAPTGMQAHPFIDNVITWFGSALGAGFGWELGSAVGKGTAHHLGEMIHPDLKKPLIVLTIVGAAVYIVYESRKGSARSDEREKNPKRVLSCANKKCSHRNCK